MSAEEKPSDRVTVTFTHEELTKLAGDKSVVWWNGMEQVDPGFGCCMVDTRSALVHAYSLAFMVGRLQRYADDVALALGVNQDEISKQFHRMSQVGYLAQKVSASRLPGEQQPPAPPEKKDD